MKNKKEELLLEVQKLKSENVRLNEMVSTIRKPELLWWAKRNAEVILSLNEKSEIVSVTTSVGPLLGFEPEEVVGRPLADFVHPFDQPLLERQFAAVLSDPDKETTLHVRGRDKENSWNWIEVNVVNQRQNPEIASMVVVFRVLKMSRETRGEGSLQRVRYQDIMNALNDGLLVSVMHADGTAGSFSEINEVACNMLGYQQEELMNLSFSELDLSYDEEAFRNRSRELLAGEGVIFETLFRKKNGESLPVEIHASVYRLEEQRAMICLVRNITNRKKAEEELRKNYLSLEAHKTELEIQYEELIRVREELEKSLGKYSFLYDFAPSGYFLLGRDSSINRLNLKAANLLGLDRETLAGVKFNRYVESAYLIVFQTFLRDIFEIKGKSDCELLLKRAGLSPILVYVEGIISEDGKDCFIMVIDITERKRSERALKESEARFQNAFEYSAIGIALVSPEGAFLRVNQSLCRIFGYTEEELMKMKFMDITHPEDLGTNVQYLELMVSGEIENYSVEKRYIHKSGDVLWTNLATSVMRNDDGSPRFFISQIMDITQRKSAEEKIMESEQKYRNLFETMIQGVVYQDREGKIISANSSASRILGLTIDQMIGRTSVDPRWRCIQEDGSPFDGEAHPAMVSLRTGRESKSVMGVFSPADRKYKWINVNARPLFRKGEKRPFQVYTTFEEITRLRESLEELTHTSQRLAILRQIDHAINQADWDDIAVNEIALLGVLKMIPCSKIYILSFDTEKQEVIIESKLENGVFKGRVENRASLTLFNLSLFSEGKCYLHQIDPDKPAGEVEQWVVSQGLNNILAVPFISGETVTGLFVLLAESAHPFTEEHVQISQDIAAQIALNMKKRELHRQLTQYASGLEQMVDQRTMELSQISSIHQAILDSVPDLLFRLSRTGVFLETYAGTGGAYFAPPKVFMGRPIGEVLPEDVSSKAMTTLKAAFRSKKTEVFEYQLPIQEMLHHFEGRIVAISEEEALCIIREITEQKRSEEFVNIQRDFATGLSICSDMSEALNLVLDTVLKLERVDCGGIYLLDEKGTGLSLAAHKGLSEGFIREKSYYEKDTLQMGVVMKGSPVFGPYSRFVGEAVPENDDNLLGLAVIPIQHEGRVIGCFNIGSKKSKTFYEQIQTQIEALVLQAGGAISRILAEKALLRTQENFSRFFNTLDDFMFILDAQGMIMMVNPVVEKVLGYTQEELYKMHVLEVHPPDRREEAGFIVGEMLAERASYCPVPLIAKDGRQIPVETRVIKGIWDEKEVLFGISRDVTERQRAQKELELRESYLSAVIRNHPGMFWMKDVEGRFLLVNDRNDQFLKAARLAKIDSVIGKTDFDFMPAEEANHYLLEDRQVIESRSPLVVEECAPFENKNLWYEKFKFPVVDKNGTVIGVSAYSVDITNRKKLEQSLLEGIERERELNDLKTKFISVASHEFRTPLATILASSESLSSYWDRMTEEQRSQRLAKIKDQVGHMNRIIEEVLDLSKMQAKDRALEPELFDIIGLCRELTEEFMNLPGRIPVIRFQSSLEKLEVFLDKKRVMTVITNLLSNAVKYTGAGKLVEVKISKKKDHLLLEVADQGIGIPAEEIKHLFEPFFRASNTGDFSGTGLGLNIVKELVIRHSGQITVESKINEGSLFTVTLPVGAKSVKKKK